MAGDLSVSELRELVRDWAVSLRAAGKTAETIRVYQRNVGQFLTFCEQTERTPTTRRALDAFTAELLDRGREGLTVRGRLTAVKQLGRWLVEVEELPADPWADVKPPAIDTKVVKPLTETEVRALLATCVSPKGVTPERRFLDLRDEAIIRLMVETGMRAGEVVGLTSEDVRWRDNPPTLTVAKAKARRGRVVPFSAKAAQAVGTYDRARRKQPHAERPEFFLGTRRRTLSYAGLYYALTQRAAEAGVVDFHPHRMRHTAAHRWLAAGGSEGGLMSVAGWSRPDMLLRYSRARAEERAGEEFRRLNLGDL